MIRNNQNGEPAHMPSAMGHPDGGDQPHVVNVRPHQGGVVTPPSPTLTSGKHTVPRISWGRRVAELLSGHKPTAVRCRQLRRAFNALYVACGYTQAQSHAKHEAMRVFVARRLDWFGRDPNCCMREIKLACFHLRNAYMSGVIETDDVRRSYAVLVPKTVRKRFALTPRILYQLSYLKRALPRPYKSDVAEAERKQLDLLCGPAYKIPSSWYNRLFNLGAWFYRHSRRPGDFLKLQAISTGTSACLSHTRAEGGKSAAFREWMLEVMDLETFVGPAPEPGPDDPRPFGFRTIAWRDKFTPSIVDALADVREDSSVVWNHKPVPIAELGWKVRMVSCSDIKLVCLSESFRAIIYNGLYMLGPCVSNGLNGIFRLKLSSTAAGDSSRQIYSGDLSKATDTLSCDAIRAFCLGAMVPFNLVSGGTINGQKIKRGTLMGIPCSWPTLSWIHAAIAHKVDSNDDFMIKGDDLVAYWTFAMVKAYRREVKFLGFILKEDFWGPKGTFCERPMCVQDGYLDIDRNGAVPLRFIHGETSMVRRGGYTPRPPILSVGRTIEKFVADYGMPRQDAYRLQQSLYYRDQRFARSYGIDPFLPVELGGLGFLPRDPERPLRRRDQRMVTFFMNHPKRFIGSSVKLIVNDESPVGKAVSAFLSYAYQIPGWHYRAENDPPYYPRDGVMPAGYLNQLASMVALKSVMTTPGDLAPKQASPYMMMKKYRTAAYRDANTYRAPALHWTYAGAWAFSGRIYPDPFDVEPLLARGILSFPGPDEKISYNLGMYLGGHVPSDAVQPFSVALTEPEFIGFADRV